ncbi:MAG: FecR/PupR family sigma factor regulator [Gammaproteobacteria bacterium]
MRSAKDIEAHAARWLVKLEAGSTPKRRAEFEAWCGKHPRHQAAFQRLAVAWKRADVMRHLHMPGEPVELDLLAPPEATESPAPQLRATRHFARGVPPTDLHRRRRLAENHTAENGREPPERRSRIWLVASRLWRALGARD